MCDSRGKPTKKSALAQGTAVLFIQTCEGLTVGILNTKNPTTIRVKPFNSKFLTSE